VNEKDLITLTEFGRAIWKDPARAHRLTQDTLSSTLLLPVSDERVIEKSLSALLERVNRDGALADSIGSPFFRLFAEERVILTALHRGRWSYIRIARMMSRAEGLETVETIEELAWNARVTLSTVLKLPYPSGPTVASPDCPIYDPKRPWTQKFLDEEIASGRPAIFLQTHLQKCTSCREALERARKVYYGVGALIAREIDVEAPNAVLAEAQELRRLRDEGNRLLGHATRFQPMTLKESLTRFSSRPEIRGALLAVAVMLLLKQFFN